MVINLDSTIYFVKRNRKKIKSVFAKAFYEKYFFTQNSPKREPIGLFKASNCLLQKSIIIWCTAYLNLKFPTSQNVCTAESVKFFSKSRSRSGIGAHDATAVQLLLVFSKVNETTVLIYARLCARSDTPGNKHPFEEDRDKQWSSNAVRRVKFDSASKRPSITGAARDEPIRYLCS
ncbi:hypothetical protein EVAR_23503_1 [Eumeta japonica]|uniref:Uncharacterized protein n=1 Tax=Eumeta variegata TaxID=151549 RepID=A0A4C1W2E6_EUMVA|nr:hypothetical protein EVAR_23503_1 [Eumeta japonica]